MTAIDCHLAQREDAAVSELMCDQAADGSLSVAVDLSCWAEVLSTADGWRMRIVDDQFGVILDEKCDYTGLPHGPMTLLLGTSTMQPWPYFLDRRVRFQRAYSEFMRSAPKCFRCGAHVSVHDAGNGMLACEWCCACCRAERG